LLPVDSSTVVQSLPPMTKSSSLYKTIFSSHRLCSFWSCFRLTISIVEPMSGISIAPPFLFHYISSIPVAGIELKRIDCGNRHNLYSAVSAEPAKMPRSSGNSSAESRVLHDDFDLLTKNAI